MARPGAVREAHLPLIYGHFHTSFSYRRCHEMPLGSTGKLPYRFPRELPMTKKQKAALLREFTTDELRNELWKRTRPRKSWQREMLAGLLDEMTETEVRAALDRLSTKRVPQPQRITRGTL